MIKLELLTEQNLAAVRAIHREDIPDSWVDNADTLWDLTQYGLEHNCIGHTYAVKYGDAYIGVILLGEAIPWETDPKEMDGVPFYRLMGFVIDNRYRNKGIGSDVLELVIKTIYDEYGIRPIALGVHEENLDAARFYLRHGFHKTEAMEGSDYYYLRYPRMIETKDLILRQGSADDWQDLYCNLWSREDVFRYMFNKASPDEEAGCKRTNLYARMHKEVKTEFFVCEKASGQVIGIAGIKELKIGKWTITDIAIGPDFHGKGYGKQIVTALLNLAFELGATEVAYDCFTQNVASKRLALSCGFTYTHSEEAELMKNGEKVILDYYMHTF